MTIPSHYVLRAWGLATGPAYALLRTIQAIVAGPCAEEAKLASQEIKQGMAQILEAEGMEAGAALKAASDKMTNVTIAFTKYSDPVLND